MKSYELEMLQLWKFSWMSKYERGLVELLKVEDEVAMLSILYIEWYFKK